MALLTSTQELEQVLWEGAQRDLYECPHTSIRDLPRLDVYAARQDEDTQVGGELCDFPNEHKAIYFSVR